MPSIIQSPYKKIQHRFNTTHTSSFALRDDEVLFFMESISLCKVNEISDYQQPKNQHYQ